MASARGRAAILEQLGRGSPELRLQIGIDRLDGPLLERHDQRRVQLGAEAQRLHRRQGLHRFHVGQPGPAAAVERQVEPAEALVDLGHLAQDPHPLGAVVGRLQLRIEGADQLVESPARR